MGKTNYAAGLMTFALVACQHVPPASANAVDVRAMHQGFDPAMGAIGAVVNDVTEGGSFDPARMDEAKWTVLADAPGAIAPGAKSLAAAARFLISSPMLAGNSEGTAGRRRIDAAVQRRIDADPRGFAQMAEAAAAQADALSAAAKARDVAAARELMPHMDRMCWNCHLRFWHPVETR